MSLLLPLSELRRNMGRRDGLPKEAKDFLDYCDATLKKSTVQMYITNLNKFYAFFNEQCPEEKNKISKIDRVLIQKYYTHLFHSNLKPATRFLIIMNLRCYLTWAREMGHIEKDPRELIQLQDFPKRPQYLPRPLEPDHDRKLIEYLKNTKAVTQRGLLLLRYTGMRVGELLDLPYDCLHQEDDGSFSVRVPLGKLNNDRLVPLTDEGLEFISGMQQEAISAKYKWERKTCLSCNHRQDLRVDVMPDPKRTYLMTSSNGRRLTYSGMRTAMNRACIKADIPHYSVHQLRHTLATVLLNGGASLATVMKILGHKKVNMTLRYAQITQTTVRKEYFAAINKAVDEYEIEMPYQKRSSDPLEAFTDLVRLIEKKRQESKNPQDDNTKVQLIKRLRRFESEIRDVL